SPGHLKEEARAYAMERQVKAVEAIKANVVNHPLQAMAIGAAAAYPLLGLVRRVPVPLALIGAGLLLSRKGSGSTRSRNGGASLANRDNGFGDAVRSTLEDAQSSVAAAGTRMKDAIATGAASTASGAASAAADAAAHAARAGEEAQDAIARLVHG